MTDEQLLHEYHDVLTDVWKTFKAQILEVSEADQYWDDVIRAFSDIGRKYNGTETEAFANRMIVASVQTLEDRYKTMRKAAGI